nr:hypothetical protein [Tanacetum cinerariifolium]
MVKVPKCMSWLDAYNKPIGDLDIMEDKVDNPRPQSTTRVLLSFEVYTARNSPGRSRGDYKNPDGGIFSRKTNVKFSQSVETALGFCPDNVASLVGWLLKEIHVTWAQLEKKQARPRPYTNYLEEIHTERENGVTNYK